MDYNEAIELIQQLIAIDGCVTPRSVAAVLGIDGKSANKLVHEMEQRGVLEEQWVRVYVPADDGRKKKDKR